MRIVIADGQPVFRAAVRSVLQSERDFHVIEVADIRSLVHELRRNPPADLTLIDADLCLANGVSVLPALLDNVERPLTAVVLWSHDPSRETVLAALRAGVAGYLEKDISPAGLIRALRAVAMGEVALSRKTASIAVAALREFDTGKIAHARSSELSLRENEVLSFLAAGAQNRQIASALSISEFTVKRHVQNILRKLQVGSRREAGAIYRAANLDFVSSGGRPSGRRRVATDTSRSS